MGWTKQYSEAWHYVQRVRDLWQSLQMSQERHERRVWPFPGFPNVDKIHVGSKTVLNGLYGVATHAAKAKDLNVWFLKNNCIQNDNWKILDAGYRAGHAAFCEADATNHKMHFNPCWNYSPAPSLMSEQQTIDVEKAINKFFTLE